MSESIETVTEITPAPGSIVAVRLRDHFPAEALSQIAEQAKATFPDNRVVVLAAGLTVDDKMVERAAWVLAVEDGDAADYRTNTGGAREYHRERASEILCAALGVTAGGSGA